MFVKGEQIGEELSVTNRDISCVRIPVYLLLKRLVSVYVKQLEER